MRDLNLGQLRTFADVVGLGSFSAAAARLGLTQPAVSLQVRQLERRLGVRLIERIGRRAQPTAAGRDLLAHLGAVEAAVSAATEAMARHRTETLGRVRLGTGATACIYLLPPLLRDLRLRFPSLEIVVRTGNSPDILKALEENAIDVALVTLPAPGRIFAVTPILEDELVAIFAADHVPPAVATAAALAALPVVLYEPASNARRLVDEWFRRAGLALKPAMELGSVEAIKVMVASGLGASILPKLALKEVARTTVVCPLRPAVSRELAYVLRKDKVIDRGMRVFLDELARATDRPGSSEGRAAQSA